MKNLLTIFTALTAHYIIITNFSIYVCEALDLFTF